MRLWLLSEAGFWADGVCEAALWPTGSGGSVCGRNSSSLFFPPSPSLSLSIYIYIYIPIYLSIGDPPVALIKEQFHRKRFESKRAKSRVRQTVAE